MWSRLNNFFSRIPINVALVLPLWAFGAFTWLIARVARGTLAELLSRNGRAGDASHDSSEVGLPHFAPRAKRVIFLTQSGGPSQLELYDEKPELMKWAVVYHSGDTVDAEARLALSVLAFCLRL